MASVKPKTKKIRVVLAEPQPIFIQGARRALEGSDAEVAAVAGTAAEAIELIEDVLPDMAIVAVAFPDQSGLTVLETVGEVIPILMLTAEDGADTIFESMMLGARGYLLKHYTDVDLAEAVHAVMRGEIVMDATSLKEFVSGVRDRFGRSNRRVRPSSLSKRERQILGLVAEGMSAEEIAKELQLAVSTVRSHTRNSYIKLGAKNKATAVREAMRLGLIDGNGKRRR